MTDAIAFIASRHGELVGWGSTPESAARSAARLGLSRCEIEPAPYTSYPAVAQSLHRRSWRTEKDLLDKLRRECLEEIAKGGSNVRLSALLDAIEDELEALTTPLPRSLSLPGL